MLSADYSSFGRGDTHHHLLGARGLAVNRGLAVARLRVSILRCLLGLDPVGLSGILAHAVRGSDRRATCPAFPLLIDVTKNRQLAGGSSSDLKKL